jgi:putative sterol carrier protein
MTTLTTFSDAITHVSARVTPEVCATVHAVYAFHFTDSGEDATLDLRETMATGWREGAPAQHGLTADFEVTLSRVDFVGLVTGTLHPMVGMATGRMRFKGNFKQALVLDRLLKQ